MTNLSIYTQEIKIHLINTHSEILNWFNEDEKLKKYQPNHKGWTINEILEHIVLTSHFLLILIDKGTNKAIKNVQNQSLKELLISSDYNLKRLNEIGITKSFKWIRPEHMQPKGLKSNFEIKEELINQMNRCLNCLEVLENGEGLLYKTTMTVNELGKLNVYEYIYFLSKHAERHIQQMKNNKNEYKK
jgi:hypothetical protein